MDRTTDTIVEFALETWASSPSAKPSAAALNHLVDAVACAIAGYSSPPATIAASVARTTSSDDPATVFGAGVRSAPAYAVFANTVMVRSLDWNDGMLAPGGGHPSDMIPAILAAGEVTRASGGEVIQAIILSYEILGGLGAHVDRVALRLDQGLFMGAATAVGVGMIYGLDKERLANAISLSIVPSIPIQATRRGPLSMWKGAATAAATMNATNAVAFARAGMTAPPDPFDGDHGLKDAITGPFDLQLPAYPGGMTVVEISHQKMFPAESHSQALLGVMAEIREWAKVDEIDAIEVEAYETLVNAIGRHPSVWDPQTRETADHSLPYLMSVALVDGTVTPASFAPERIADPLLRPIMAKVKVRENDEYSAQYRPAGMELAGSPRVKVSIRRNDGAELVRELTYPKGHSMNPMSRADIDRKFDAASESMLPTDERDRIRDAWWGIVQAGNAADVVATLSDFGLNDHGGTWPAVGPLDRPS